MHTVHRNAELRARVRDWHRNREVVGFVPTMGNLHAGHLALVEEAARRADRVVVSIFVNPSQFSPGEDLDNYPRTLQADCAQLAGYGVDVVFAPGEAEIYPDGVQKRTVVDVPELTGILCGAARPGHFVGVATVVAKLFNIVQPDLAVFGRKDFQQLRVIEHMVRDLDMPVQIVGGPIVRESDGLAMSSRNAYLTADERERAALLHRTLREGGRRIDDGERDFPALEAMARERLEAGGFRPDYFSVRRRSDLAPAAADDTGLVILGAAYLGRARLIDNVELPLDVHESARTA